MTHRVILLCGFVVARFVERCALRYPAMGPNPSVFRVFGRKYQLFSSTRSSNTNGNNSNLNSNTTNNNSNLNNNNKAGENARKRKKKKINDVPNERFQFFYSST